MIPHAWKIFLALVIVQICIFSTFVGGTTTVIPLSANDEIAYHLNTTGNSLAAFHLHVSKSGKCTPHLSLTNLYTNDTVSYIFAKEKSFDFIGTVRSVYMVSINNTGTPCNLTIDTEHDNVTTVTPFSAYPSPENTSTPWIFTIEADHGAEFVAPFKIKVNGVCDETSSFGFYEATASTTILLAGDSINQECYMFVPQTPKQLPLMPSPTYVVLDPTFVDFLNESIEFVPLPITNVSGFNNAVMTPQNMQNLTVTTDFYVAEFVIDSPSSVSTFQVHVIPPQYSDETCVYLQGTLICYESKNGHDLVSLNGSSEMLKATFTYNRIGTDTPRCFIYAPIGCDYVTIELVDPSAASTSTVSSTTGGYAVTLNTVTTTTGGHAVTSTSTTTGGAAATATATTGSVSPTPPSPHKKHFQPWQIAIVGGVVGVVVIGGVATAIFLLVRRSSREGYAAIN